MAMPAQQMHVILHPARSRTLQSAQMTAMHVQPMPVIINRCNYAFREYGRWQCTTNRRLQYINWCVPQYCEQRQQCMHNRRLRYINRCILHTPVNTDDGNACTTDACDTSTGAITHTGVNTDDGNACTTDGCDTSTGVFHTPVSTDDGNACTTDACDTSTGAITHAPVNTDDGNACTTDACDTYSNHHTGVNTDDGNACTTDGCDTSTGVFHTPVSTDDGMPVSLMHVILQQCLPCTGKYR